MPVHELLPRLPEPAQLRRRCRAFAVLDVILTEDFPTYMFDPEFAPDVALGRMDNGSGDNFNIVFDPAGVIGFGFDHESDVSPWREDPRQHWPGLLDGVPRSLTHWRDEPAFQCDALLDATVCFWRENRDTVWSCGPVRFAGGQSDGADWLFEAVTGEPVAAYRRYASDYFERDIDAEAVARVLAAEPLTPALVTALNPQRDVAGALAAATATGHPVAG